ncbi:hypothetical protein BH18THE2_BH18THE2_15000 [soil metagenome]
MPITRVTLAIIMKVSIWVLNYLIINPNWFIGNVKLRTLS